METRRQTPRLCNCIDYVLVKIKNQKWNPGHCFIYCHWRDHFERTISGIMKGCFKINFLDKKKKIQLGWKIIKERPSTRDNRLKTNKLNGLGIASIGTLITTPVCWSRPGQKCLRTSVSNKKSEVVKWSEVTVCKVTLLRSKLAWNRWENFTRNDRLWLTMWWQWANTPWSELEKTLKG